MDIAEKHTRDIILYLCIVNKIKQDQEMFCNIVPYQNSAKIFGLKSDREEMDICQVNTVKVPNFDIVYPESIFFFFLVAPTQNL